MQHNLKTAPTPHGGGETVADEVACKCRWNSLKLMKKWGRVHCIKGDLLVFALPLQLALILIHLPFNSTSILINVNKI
jgi:hypothetical protein